MHQIEGCYLCDGPSACTKWIQCSFLPRNKSKLSITFYYNIMLHQSARSNKQRKKEDFSNSEYNERNRGKNVEYRQTTSCAEFICSTNVYLDVHDSSQITLHEHLGATLAISDCGIQHLLPCNWCEVVDYHVAFQNLYLHYNCRYSCQTCIMEYVESTVVW